jgi:hypothetical protein
MFWGSEQIGYPAATARELSLKLLSDASWDKLTNAAEMALEADFAGTALS